MDWLSLALHDDEAQVRTASTNRAQVAVKHRVERRFARYMGNAKSEVERNARLSAIDEELRLLANEVAVEYSAPDAEALYTAATKLAYDFGAPFQEGQQGTPAHGYTPVPCAQCGTPATLGAPCPKCGHLNQPGNGGQQPGAAQAPGGTPEMGGLRNRLQIQGAEVPTDGYDRRTVDADETIGTTPASSSGESFKGAEKSLWDLLGDANGAHPHDEQDIEDKGKWRDDQSQHQSDPNPPKVKHKVEDEDLGKKNPYKEQVGPGTSTFGDASNAVDPVNAGSASKLGKWHVLNS